MAQAGSAPGRAVIEGRKFVAAAELIHQTRLLLAPDASSDEFSRNYKDAPQHQPDAVLAHRVVTAILSRDQFEDKSNQQSPAETRQDAVRSRAGNRLRFCGTSENSHD